MGIPLSPAQQVVNLKTDMGGSPEQSYVTVSSVGTGSFESFVITCPAGDEAAQADYFSFSQPDGQKFAIWLDVDADGTAPSGAVYTAADNKIEIDVVSTPTPTTAAATAALIKTAIELDGDFDEYTIVDNEDGTLSFTATALGNPANAAPHAADDLSAGNFLASVTSGSSASSQNDYFVLHDDDTGLFHVWLNVNSEGVDPDPGGGSVGIEVAVSAADSAATVAAAIATAVNANAEFEAEYDGAGRVKITTATNAVVVDLADGDLGVTVSVSTQGSVQKYSAAMSPSDISNAPSAF